MGNSIDDRSGDGASPSRDGRRGTPGACVVDRAYLLALNLPLREYDGQYWADASWAKDLHKHLSYLPRLTLLCPVRHQPPDAGWQPIDGPGLRIAGFGESSSIWSFLLRLPLLLPRLWIEIGRAEIVHSGVAGWPIPLGWICAPLARFRRRKLVLIVESAFWRLTPGKVGGLKRRFQAWLWEAAARWCMAMADYAAYTQPDYRESLPAPRAGGGRVVQASWIDAADCIDDAIAEASWQVRRDQPLRFLFASRLIPEKGTLVLGDAFAHLAASGAEVFIDIIGDGPALEALRVTADTAWGRCHVRFLPPRPYGAGFLALVAQYDALLSPSLSDEQPRIVYDGYSQGIATIGSDKPGLAACIQDGRSGLLVPAGNPAALAAAMVTVDRRQLQAWGLAGLGLARAMTHERLHADRCRDLNRMFGEACALDARHDDHTPDAQD